MTRNRLNMLLAVVAMVIVAVGGFFFGVQPQLAQAAADRVQQATVQTANTASTRELARLKEQAKSLPQMQADLAKLKASVPSSADMASFYAELDDVASAAGTTVSSITTSDAMAYTPPATTDAQVATGGTATASPTTTPSPAASASAAAAPTAAAAPSAPSVTTNAQITASNFTVVPVSVAVDGSFDQALAFVKGVQSGARLFLINDITSAVSKDSTDSAAVGSTTWTFGGYVYVLDADATASGTTATNG